MSRNNLSLSYRHLGVQKAQSNTFVCSECACCANAGTEKDQGRVVCLAKAWFCWQIVI